MELRRRSVKGRRFWSASGSQLAIITVALQLPFFGIRDHLKSKQQQWHQATTNKFIKRDQF